MKGEWLLECYRARRRVSENDYLVGESKPSEKNESDDSMHSPPGSPVNETSFSTNSLFKRQSTSNRESTSPPNKTVNNGSQEKSEELMPPPPQLDDSIAENQAPENTEKSPADKSLASSPARRSLRNKSAFVVDETDSPALRHKRVNQLAKSKTTPNSPKTPNSAGTSDGDSDHNISNLVADMETPVRQVTYNVLKEKKAQESPRSKRLQKLLETPVSSQAALNKVESPMPELPECMRPPAVNYALRPDASPDNMHWHKRKWDTLEPYRENVPEEKRTKYVPTVR